MVTPQLKASSKQNDQLYFFHPNIALYKHSILSFLPSISTFYSLLSKVIRSPFLSQAILFLILSKARTSLSFSLHFVFISCYLPPPFSLSFLLSLPLLPSCSLFFPTPLVSFVLFLLQLYTFCLFSYPLYSFSSSLLSNLISSFLALSYLFLLSFLFLSVLWLFFLSFLAIFSHFIPFFFRSLLYLPSFPVFCPFQASFSFSLSSLTPFPFPFFSLTIFHPGLFSRFILSFLFSPLTPFLPFLLFFLSLSPIIPFLISS